MAALPQVNINHFKINLKIKIMNIIWLGAATWFAVIIFIAGSYERIYRIPTWFENPPQSFALIRPQTKTSTRFWIPVQILFILSFIGALITNWSDEAIRFYLIVAVICFVAVVALTGAYFVKEILTFSNMPANTPLTPQLKTRASRWLKWTTSRNVLQFVSMVMLVTALLKYSK